MIFRKVIFFILLSVTLFATQNNVNDLAKFSASSLFNLDSYSLKETLKVYLKNNPKIKALKITEAGNLFITYYTKNNEQIFYKPIPNEYLQLVNYSSDIIYDDRKIGQITIYYENQFIANSLTKEEKAWLKQHPKILVSNEFDWAPYDYSIDGEAKGYSIEYMQLLAKKIGVEFEFISASWNELLEKFKNKEIDMMHVMSKTKQRENYTLFSDQYIKMNLSLITRRDSNIKSLNDLNNKKLALAKGWSSTKFIKENYPNIEIIEKEYTQEILNEVAFGNVDAAIEDNLIADYFINKNFLTNLKISKNIYIPNFNQDLHIGIRDDWSLFHSIIQKALKSMQDNELITLNQKWLKQTKTSTTISFTQEEELFIKQHPEIIVGGEMDWPPFDFVENGQYTGVANDYLKLIEKYSGLKFTVKTGYTWDELLQLAKDKKVDLLPMLYFSNSRTEFLNFTNDYLNIRHYLYAKDNSKPYKSLNELNGATIAILKGSAQIEILKEQYPQIKILETENSLEAIDKVISNEADALIESSALITYLLQKHNIKGIMGLFPTNLDVNKLYMGVRKDWPLLRDIIQKSIDSITPNERNKITKKWIDSNIQSTIEFSKEEQTYLDNKQNLTLCIKPNLLPYEYLNNNEYQGIAAEYMNIISKNTNLPLQILPVKSNNETATLVAEKKCDIRPVLFTKRVSDIPYNVSSAYLNDYIVLITTIEKPFIKDITNNLDKVYVVENTQQGIVNILKKKYPTIQLKYVDSAKDAYEMVLTHKAYGFIDKSLSTVHTIQKNYSSNLKVMTQLLEMDLGVGIKEDEVILLNIVNKVLNSIDEQTKIQIRNNWSSATIETKTDYTYVWYILFTVFIIASFVLYRQVILKRANNLLEEANTKLNEQKEEFETIFYSSKDGIAILDLETKFLNCNEAYCQMLGYEKEELLTKSCIELTLPEDMDSAINAMKEVIEKGYKTNFEKRCLKKDGSVVTVNMTGSLYPDKQKALLITKDISTNKILEEQSKMASMGEMIGNIAHQWRQPLSVISTSASGLKMQSVLNEDVTKDDISKFTDIIINQTDYLSNTIENFRDFLKGDKRHSQIKASDVIEYTLSLVKATISNNYITLIENIDDTLYIDGSKNELSEAFINIINNSKDALKEKIKDQKDRLIFVTVKEASNNKVEIIFCDSGGGIPDKIIKRIFEPYFTSKHQSVGTGLGLSMADKIIRERHNGLIKVHNKEFEHNNKKYRGACFTILLNKYTK